MSPISLNGSPGVHLRSDTRRPYGDCESRLGELLPIPQLFSSYLETAPIRKTRITSEDVMKVGLLFYRSLENLRQTSVEGLLIHDAEDLKLRLRLLVSLLVICEGQKLTKKIGVSVYTGAQIDLCLQLFKPDIVQLSSEYF